MVPADSPIAALKDLKASASASPAAPSTRTGCCSRPRPGTPPASTSRRRPTVAFGAPPLLALKLEQGELDAGLLYWTYCARLEPKGFRRLIGADDIMRAFGATGSIALIGYLLDDATVTGGPRPSTGFARASQGRQGLLATDPRRLGGGAAADVGRGRGDLPGAEARLPRRHPAPAPRHGAQRRRDASTRVLARLGGERLVGAGATLPPRLYFDGTGNGEARRPRPRRDAPTP